MLTITTEIILSKKRGLWILAMTMRRLRVISPQSLMECVKKSPKIKFFEQVNPEWERGTELVCVGAIPTKDIFRYIERFFTKSQNLGKLDAKAAMEQAKKSAATS